MSAQGFTSVLLNEAGAVEELDSPGFQSNSPQSNSPQSNSPSIAAFRIARNSVCSATVQNRASRFSNDSEASTKHSLLRLRQSIRTGLAEMQDTEHSAEEDECSIDEGELLFSGNLEEITKAKVGKKKLLSQSFACRFIVSVVVFLNTVVIAAESTFISYNCPIFDALEFGFTIFYVCEITFRLYEVGWRAYLTEMEWAWNVFDVVITFLSVVDTVTNFLTGQTSRASIGRLFRIFRILRMFRAMRFMNEVDYVLATAAKATVKLAVVVSLAIFVSAIIATNMLWDSADASIADMFSSLGISMWSMFKIMTLDDWVFVSEKVIDEKPGMVVFFIIFIFCTSIALISLVPAIFIEISLNSKSREEQLHEERRKASIKQQKRRLLQTLFRLTDFDNNGTISINEVKKVLTDDRTLRQLQDAGLTEPGELHGVRLGLFDLWEEQLEETNCPDTEINEEDFIDGILRSATDVSQASLWRAVTGTRLMLRDFASCVRQELREIKHTQKSMSKLQESNDSKKLLAAIREVMQATRNDLANMLGGQGPNDWDAVVIGASSNHTSSKPEVFSSEAGLSSRLDSMCVTQTSSSPSGTTTMHSLKGGYGPAMPNLSTSIKDRLANMLTPRRSPRSGDSANDDFREKNQQKKPQTARILGDGKHQTDCHGRSEKGDPRKFAADDEDAYIRVSSNRYSSKRFEVQLQSVLPVSSASKQRGVSTASSQSEQTSTSGQELALQSNPQCTPHQRSVPRIRLAL